MKKHPIYVYDVRGQFERPLFVVYDEKHIDYLLALIDDCSEMGPAWKRPDWAYVSNERMHPYEPGPYKPASEKVVGRSMSPTRKSDRVSTIEKRNWNLMKENDELKKLVKQANEARDKASNQLASWQADNMSALRDLAVKVLMADKKETV